MGECLMYGLDLEARCISSVVDEDSVRFLIGTHNIKMNNQISCLSVDSDYSRISSQSFPHPKGEVRALAASPHQPDVVACSVADYRTTSPYFGIHVYRMDFDGSNLEEISSQPMDECQIGFAWQSQSNHASSLGSSSVRVFDMNKDLQQLSEVSFSGQAHSHAWSPHNAGVTLGLTVNKDVLCMDSRNMKLGEALTIKEAHANRALHLDFNPNLQHVIASCGDDGFIRIWDWRKPNQPIFSLKPHAHWVWQVRYHPVHDQLILSTGSDACVALSCAQSVSSEATSTDPEDTVTSIEEEAEKLQDGPLERIDEHEESVYACAWSVADPWTFASLSHDGRVVVSRVRRKHKYILMQL